MKLGALDISTVKLGTNQVQAVYQGSNLVWQNAPVATAATGVGQTSFTANWNAYSGATYYLLDVSESSDFSTFVYEDQQVNAPSTSYVVIGLNSNTTYYYRVRASDGALPFQFSVKTDNAGVSTSTQFKMPLTTSTGLGFTVNWGDGSPLETITDHTLAVHDYGVAGTYTISVTGSILGWQFAFGGDRLKMLNVLQWGSLTISVGQGFQGCANLTCSATDAPLITSTSLLRYFQDCTNFNGAIGNWDMSNVTSMNRMFRTTSSFNQPIGNWSVQNVTDMLEMFEGATAFNQDIGSWNVSNVSNFRDFMNGKTAANYSAANLDSIYNGWSSLPSVQPNISIKFGTIKYTAAGAAGKAILTGSPNNWTIVDGGI